MAMKTMATKTTEDAVDNINSISNEADNDLANIVQGSRKRHMADEPADLDNSGLDVFSALSSEEGKAGINLKKMNQLA